MPQQTLGELFTSTMETLQENKDIPDAPSTDGTYILQCVVSSGVPTYSWISAPSASGVSY